MFKKVLIYALCFMSLTVAAGEIVNKKSLLRSSLKKRQRVGHTVFIKNGVDQKVVIGKYAIVLTRVDDRMNRIHLMSTPRNRSLIVDAFDRSGKKMKAERVGQNLSTQSTSKHKYMYKAIPEYLVIR